MQRATATSASSPAQCRQRRRDTLRAAPLFVHDFLEGTAIVQAGQLVGARQFAQLVLGRAAMTQLLRE
jgi:hypothetical protein